MLCQFCNEPVEDMLDMQLHQVTSCKAIGEKEPQIVDKNIFSCNLNDNVTNANEDIQPSMPKKATKKRDMSKTSKESGERRKSIRQQAKSLNQTKQRNNSGACGTIDADEKLQRSPIKLFVRRIDPEENDFRIFTNDVKNRQQNSNNKKKEKKDKLKKREYDTSNKILPLSQPLGLTEETKETTKTSTTTNEVRTVDESTTAVHLMNHEELHFMNDAEIPIEVHQKEETTAPNFAKIAEQRVPIPDVEEITITTTALPNDQQVPAVPQADTADEQPSNTSQTPESTTTESMRLTESNNLPEYVPTQRIPATNKQYNSLEAKTFVAEIEKAYEETIKWRKNLFKLPTGKSGKSFITELTTWLEEFNNEREMKFIALKVFMLLPNLIMQKPSKNSKAKEHSGKMEERISLWKEGKIMDLLKEGKNIQKNLSNAKKTRTTEDIARNFAKLMLQGKVSAALKFLTENSEHGFLIANEEIMKELQTKHPQPSPIQENTLQKGPLEEINKNYFDTIDETTIATAARLTKGAAGPSQLDADQYRQILCSKAYKKEGKDLREQVAKLARKLATEIMDPSALEAYIACRLIPLNKNPGVRPIGIGEILRRIIGKAIGWSLKKDIQEAAGPLQASTGLKGGAEAAIHAMKLIFEEENTEAVILIDASNAFNSLNRQVALHNMQYTCPPFATILINTYRNPSRLFIQGGLELSSQEGTTQGDNLAMSFYGLALIPLINSLKYVTTNIKQVWLADDATGAGKLKELKEWWDVLIKEGDKLGYFVNEKKSWLILKNPELLREATELFENSEIKFTVEGKRHLGAAIGSESFKASYMQDIVDEWCKEVKRLAVFAQTQPHAAFAAYIHGEQHKFTYFLRTLKNMENHLNTLDEVINDELLPALFGEKVNDKERELFSLPIKLGGLGLPILNDKAQQAYTNSKEITEKLVDIIRAQGEELPDEGETNEVKRKVQNENETKTAAKQQIVLNSIPPDTKRTLEEVGKDGASGWLSVLPLEDHGFVLNKSEFRDALALRYNKEIKGLPSKCPCGQNFNVTHAMNCKKGGFVIMRHNNIRDLEANLLRKVCNDVELEPPLQPLTGENLPPGTLNEDGAKTDIRAKGFWRRGQSAFFDVRVTNPNSPSMQNVTVAKILDRNEKEKKRNYNQRVMNIEHGTFTPLVFTINGSMGVECSMFHKQLAEQIAVKSGEKYERVLTYIRTKLSFTILRSALICLRGSRVVKKIENLTNVVEDIGLGLHETTGRGGV